MKGLPEEITSAEVFFPGDTSNEISVGDFLLSTCGITTQGTPSIGEFSRMLSFLVWISRNQPWWIGDLVMWGERRFGEDFYNSVDLDPWAVDQIERHAAVSRAVPPNERNKNLWHTHHREVCKLAPEARKEMLDAAEEQVMSSAVLRKAVQGKSNKTKPKKRKAKW